MKIISWNVNGLRSVIAKGLPAFVAHAEPDIVCLQETKIDRERLTAKEFIPGYRLFLSPASKSGYSGVATYLRDPSAHCEPASVAYGTGNQLFDQEGRFLITDHRSFTLYNIYIPSGTTGEIRQKFKYEFLELLLKHLQNLSQQERDKVVLCGDFNICHRPIDIHHPDVAEKRQLSGFLLPERRWIDAFCEMGFVDAFRHVHGDKSAQYTWWTFRAGARLKNLGWRIDYFFVAEALAERIGSAEIFAAVTGSDHCPLSLTLTGPRN